MTDNVVPLSDEALTPRFMLLDVLEDVENIQAIAIITLDNEGYCKAHWSCPKQQHLCALAMKLHAATCEAILE